MRRIEYTNAFKKDYKRELKGKYQSVLSNEFQAIISAIAQNQPLDARHRDIHNFTSQKLKILPHMISYL